MGHSFNWIDLITTGKIPAYFGGVVIVWFFVAALAIIGRRQLSRLGNSAVIPDETLTVRNFWELLLETITGFMKDIIGPRWLEFLPLIGTMTVLILFANLMGLIPGMSPATDSTSTTVACTMIIFVFYHYVGIREHGFAYVKQFLGPVWWLSWMIFPIEIVSHFARILSLSIRLFGNMFGDHMVLTLFLTLVPVAVPAVFYGLGLFVCVVQTFVFALLSMIYIGSAISHEGH